MANSSYKRGDKVQGVPGRISHDWTGTVVSIRADGGVMVEACHWWPARERDWADHRRRARGQTQRPQNVAE